MSDTESVEPSGLAGKCLCETVSFVIDGPARPVVNCHCSRCRRHTGHFMAATAASVSDVEISGDTLTWYEAAEGTEYGFCSRCGSTLFWRTARRPGLVSIAAGTLTPPTGLETVAAIYTDYASDYHSFDHSIPAHGDDFPGSG
ncbi:MAG TPA: GFA family protein [Acidimicrobiia bacterium]|nr:GFA family protein [Acidimicrobiia bacterium]